MKDSIRLLVLFSLASFLVACANGGKNSESAHGGEHDSHVAQVIDPNDGTSGDSEAVDSDSDADGSGGDDDADGHADGPDGDDDADGQADGSGGDDDAAEAAAAEKAAADAAAAEKAAAEAAAAEKVAAEKAAAEAAAAEAAAIEAATPRGYSFQIKNPEASSIRQSFQDECQAMGDWATVPSEELVAGIEAYLKRAAADGTPMQRCDATYLMLGHDDMQAIPACSNGGMVFVEGNDGSIPHVYLRRESGRVSDDSIGTAGRRSRLAGDLASTRNGGRVGRSLRPGDSLLVWDRWNNSRVWNGWVIILEK